MENAEIRQLAEDFSPYIYLAIGVFVGLVIGVILYFVLNLKSPLMQSINDDFAKDRPVTVFDDEYVSGKGRVRNEIGKGISRISRDKTVIVEMDDGHGRLVPIGSIRFDDVSGGDGES